MLTLCVPVVLVAFLAALGRSATPRSERQSRNGWAPGALAGNVLLGTRRLMELHDRSPVASYQRTQLHT